MTDKKRILENEGFGGEVPEGGLSPKLFLAGPLGESCLRAGTAVRRQFHRGCGKARFCGYG